MLPLKILFLKSRPIYQNGHYQTVIDHTNNPETLYKNPNVKNYPLIQAQTQYAGISNLSISLNIFNFWPRIYIEIPRKLWDLSPASDDLNLMHDNDDNYQSSEEILKRRIDKNIRNFTDQMVYFIEFESATNNHKLKNANKKIEIIKIDLVKKKPYYTAWTAYEKIPMLEVHLNSIFGFGSKSILRDLQEAFDNRPFNGKIRSHLHSENNDIQKINQKLNFYYGSQSYIQQFQQFFGFGEWSEVEISIRKMVEFGMLRKVDFDRFRRVKDEMVEEIDQLKCQIDQKSFGIKNESQNNVNNLTDFLDQMTKDFYCTEEQISEKLAKINTKKENQLDEKLKSKMKESIKMEIPSDVQTLENIDRLAENENLTVKDLVQEQSERGQGNSQTKSNIQTESKIKKLETKKYFYDELVEILKKMKTIDQERNNYPLDRNAIIEIDVDCVQCLEKFAHCFHDDFLMAEIDAKDGKQAKNGEEEAYDAFDLENIPSKSKNSKNSSSSKTKRRSTQNIFDQTLNPEEIKSTQKRNSKLSSQERELLSQINKANQKQRPESLDQKLKTSLDAKSSLKNEISGKKTNRYQNVDYSKVAENHRVRVYDNFRHYYEVVQGKVDDPYDLAYDPKMFAGEMVRDDNLKIEL